MTIAVNNTGKCPHCGVVNRFEEVKEYHRGGYFGDKHVLKGKLDQPIILETCRCTGCGDIIIFLNQRMMYPLGSQRGHAPQEVPQKIAEDFNEACLVESLSNKASAALARRCLQNMLHDQGIKKKDLNEEIDEAVKSLPPYLSGGIDAIRHVGNFATHPMKFTQTGDIVEVEEGETEWILDVLEGLFDFYYVAPAKTKEKRDVLNTKLAAAGKPPLK